MTSLALVLVVWLPSANLRGDDPKKLTAQLQGLWQEEVLRGEDPAVRYKITFEGEKVTIRYREQVLTGSVIVSSTNWRGQITMVIDRVEGTGHYSKATFTSIFEVDEKIMHMSVYPPVPAVPVRRIEVPRRGDEPPRFIEVPVPQDQQGMGLASFTLTFHKVNQ
ncbi:MAG TPA: hypothetical protein VLM40_10940 [Gemmata sp.]|nr:hypothetical protein [Gemmata sp.]